MSGRWSRLEDDGGGQICATSISFSHVVVLWVFFFAEVPDNADVTNDFIKARAYMHFRFISREPDNFFCCSTTSALNRKSVFFSLPKKKEFNTFIQCPPLWDLKMFCSELSTACVNRNSKMCVNYQTKTAYVLSVVVDNLQANQLIVNLPTEIENLKLFTWWLMRRRIIFFY